MNELDKDSVIGISALLVHAAKIDEIYSEISKDRTNFYFLQLAFLLWNIRRSWRRDYSR